MKKLLLIFVTVFCLWQIQAQPISVPGSSFPIVSTPSNYWRFLGLTTNGDSGGNSSLTRSNWTIRYDDLVANLAAIINPSFPWLIVTNGSATATIQSQFNSLTSGGVIAFQPGVYSITTTLQITNPMVILGDGATLQYPPLLTNIMVDTGTNYRKQLYIDNLNFDGQTSVGFNSATYYSTFPVGNTIWPHPFNNPHWTNRTGLRLESSGGVLINNCYFHGWSGNGMLCVSAVSGAQYNYPKLLVQNCRFYTNFLGCMLASTVEDAGGYVGNTSELALSCEYAMLAHNDIFQNYIGLSASPGNCVIDNNFIDENYLGMVQLTQNGNGAHGRYNNNSFNHNNYALWALFQSAGGEYQNNYFGRNGQEVSGFGTNIVWPNGSASGIHFDNCQSIQFNNNHLTKEWLTFTNGCNGTIAHNMYGGVSFGFLAFNLGVSDSNLVWGVTGPQTNYNSGMRVYDNYEVLGLQNDNTMGAILSTSTNSASVGSLPYASDGTNFGGWTSQVLITTNGGLAFATNAVMPQPVPGQVVYWLSNYDGWIITPTKTNRIFQGQ